MLKLIKNVECYAPVYLGRRDILVAHEKIIVIDTDIQSVNLPGVEVFNCDNKIACPGFIDQHVHILGGGGEQGPQSSISPITAEELVSAGITTVVGLLGADFINKSMEGLLMKAYSLEADGLTSYIYAGHYGLPAVTITGRLLTDIALIEKVIGAGEIAISDYRSACPALYELQKLSYEVITGGMLGKKAGVIHLHVGDGRSMLKPLIQLLESSDFPISMYVPTHLNRNMGLFDQAVQYWLNGGNIDLTAGEAALEGCKVPDCLDHLLKKGNSLDRVTVSSDGNGSSGQAHTGTMQVSALFNDIRSAVIDKKLPFETVLTVVTANVARLLMLYPEKGILSAGSDADILVLDKETLELEMVFARGRLMLKNK